MNDLTRRELSLLSSSPNMTEADLIIMRTGLKRRGREYLKARATEESQMIVGHKKYPISSSHYPGQSLPSNTSYLDILHMLMLVVHRSELQDKVRHCNLMYWKTKMQTDNLRMFSKHIQGSNAAWGSGSRGLDTWTASAHAVMKILQKV